MTAHARVEIMKALRICPTCGLEAHTEEDLNLFVPSKKSLWGRDNRCRKCEGRRARKYYEDHAEERREYSRKWREANPERVKETNRKYREVNYERLKAYRLEYYKANVEKVTEEKRRYRHENPFQSMVTRIKARSKNRELDFDLDIEYMKQLWVECGGICSMTGVTMLKKPENHDPFVVSVDRVIPEKGYVKGNVRLVCFWYNWARSSYSDEFTLDMFQRTIDHVRVDGVEVYLKGKR